eukprot:TRINITY_DN12984_c0_g1_i3.p1 TRINITY_DN12984_c0_g1~~TRINITY_DN12984_c0_g1_i3.p1  ORF type:complete len:212 (+),score=64.77 TRINITY_DN12984_c0_g1_i3:69-638(+)
MCIRDRRRVHGTSLYQLCTTKISHTRTSSSNDTDDDEQLNDVSLRAKIIAVHTVLSMTSEKELRSIFEDVYPDAASLASFVERTASWESVDEINPGYVVSFVLRLLTKIENSQHGSGTRMKHIISRLKPLLKVYQEKKSSIILEFLKESEPHLHEGLATQIIGCLLSISQLLQKKESNDKELALSLIHI